MISEKVQALELENKRLRTLILSQSESIPQPKDCEHCKHYIRHYGRDNYGTYFKLYSGHCACSVPARKRKGKKSPAPEDTCLCFEKR